MPIRGTAFFSGGSISGSVPLRFPKGSVTVIGNTFGNEYEHRNALGRGSEDLVGNRTWHNLLQWLEVVEQDPGK